jgi:hypothetical protein
MCGACGTISRAQALLWPAHSDCQRPRPCCLTSCRSSASSGGTYSPGQGCRVGGSGTTCTRCSLSPRRYLRQTDRVSSGGAGGDNVSVKCVFVQTLLLQAAQQAGQQLIVPHTRPIRTCVSLPRTPTECGTHMCCRAHARACVLLALLSMPTIRCRLQGGDTHRVESRTSTLESEASCLTHL